MATLMDEIMNGYKLSREEEAYAKANPDRWSGLTEALGRGGAAISRSLIGAPESVGAIRAPSFQSLAQAAAMSQAINPARAEIGNQALSQAASNRTQRDIVRGSFTSSSPFYGEPEGLGLPTAADTFTAKAPMPDEVGFGYRPSMNPALAPRMPDEVGFQYRPSMNPALAPRMPDEVGFQYRPSMNPLANPALNQPVVAGLDTTNRPAPMASSVTAPAREQGFFEKLFKGPQYQSNNMLLQAEGQPINFGDPNNAADFFRADALLRQQNPAFFGLLGGNNG